MGCVLFELLTGLHAFGRDENDYSVCALVRCQEIALRQAVWVGFHPVTLFTLCIKLHLKGDMWSINCHMQTTPSACLRTGDAGPECMCASVLLMCCRVKTMHVHLQETAVAVQAGVLLLPKSVVHSRCTLSIHSTRCYHERTTLHLWAGLMQDARQHSLTCLCLDYLCF